MADDHSLRSRGPLDRSRCPPLGSDKGRPAPQKTPAVLSTLECLLSTHPPILESLLLQLPTSSILDLYHTSNYLRVFLQGYPTAWNHLSFRSLNPGRITTRQTSPASDSSGDSTAPQSKLYALDRLLLRIIHPFGTRLKSLELDHTAVCGFALTHTVLTPRRDTLQHLSVRGCKQVSLKYHIVPFLALFRLEKLFGESKSEPNSRLALKSLYTFRCRHHRRRPYTPSSLVRRESDSEHTHELIKICHILGIWTDTAWCPTPGGRCLRRKDYSVGRGTPDARAEVWVVFDRLWRSENRLGPSEHSDMNGSPMSRGQLWENAELGFNGEPLGCESRPGHGEGKALATHLRKSHRRFIENIKCYDCGTEIHERCEHCSVRMHCMGCRKTLCENCAFSRPLPKDPREKSDADTATGDSTGNETCWWAPGRTRNPNLMMQEILPDPDNNSNSPNSTLSPSLNMYWCCLKPMFSNGGGVTFVGPGMTGSVTNHIRTAPLPRGEGYEDPEFARISTEVGTSSTAQDDHHPTGDQTRHGPDDQILNWLLFGPGSQDQNPCPRSLCQQCWERPGWRAACLVCKEPFCFAHDLRGLNMRICGYKDLAVEKAQLEEGISKFRAIVEAWDNSDKAQNMTLTELDKTFLGYFTDLAASLGSLGKLRDILKLIKLPETIGPEVWKEIEDLTLRQRSGQILLRPLDHSQSTTPCPSGGDTQASQMDSSIEIPWRGCGSFMCPQYRSIGDHRPKCTAAARQCALCDVHVCPECLALKPACDCSYCKDNYHCPNCFHRLEHLCKKTEEEEEKLKIAKEIELKKAAAMYKKRMADQMADQVGEFLAFVLGENEEPGDGSR